MVANEPTWLGVPELARRFRLDPETVRRNLLHERRTPDEPIPPGKLPALKIGHQFRVHVSAVERYEQLGMPDGVPANGGAVATVRRSAKRVNGNIPDHLGDL